MKQKFDPRRNYNETRKAIGYVPRKKATQKDYDRIGFMSGLEVHQQLDVLDAKQTRADLIIIRPDERADDETLRGLELEIETVCAGATTVAEARDAVNHLVRLSARTSLGGRDVHRGR